MMDIHRIYSIRQDIDSTFIVDLDYTDYYGARSRADFAYRASDQHSPLTPLITQWIADNNPEILPYVAPTHQELRATMPDITKRQLRLTLVRNGISLETVAGVIAAMTDGLEKQEAEIEWQDASEFNRLHPTLLLVANSLSLSAEQVDALWDAALAS